MALRFRIGVKAFVKFIILIFLAIQFFATVSESKNTKAACYLLAELAGDADVCSWVFDLDKHNPNK